MIFRGRDGNSSPQSAIRWPGLRFPFPRNSRRTMAKNFTLRGISAGFRAGLRFPFPWNSRAMAKNFTSRGISAVFPRVSAGFLCRSHKGTAKSPSRKSRLICKKIPFRENPAEFPAGNRTWPQRTPPEFHQATSHRAHCGRFKG